MKKKILKHICILSDCYIPRRNSAAGMIYNLSRAFRNDSYEVTCVFGGINPVEYQYVNPNAFNAYDLKDINFINSNFLLSFRDKTNIHRLIYEFFLSINLTFKCLFYLRKSNIDYVIWYGPSAFLWLPAFILKFIYKAPVYYILRDIFPDWLNSLKIIKSKTILKFLNLLTYPQYLVPDVIGLETKWNVEYIRKKIGNNKKLEILGNWSNLNSNENLFTFSETINIFENYISNLKKVDKNIIPLVYTGNMSVAHDLNRAINFFENNIINRKITFKLNINIFGKSNAKQIELKPQIDNNFNKKVWGNVPDYNLPHIYSLIDIGLITLNYNLITENIPGKFVSYTQFGLGIVCFANTNSSIAKLIRKYDCGVVIDLTKSIELNIKLINIFFLNFKVNKNLYSKNSKKLFDENFNIKFTKRKLIKSFKKFS